MKKELFVMLVGFVLLVGIISGCTEEEKKEETPTNNAPETMFSYSIDNNTVTFTDESTDADENDVLTWSWDFGDGESSTEQNPVYTYATNGIYTVTLTVSDGTDTDEDSKDITIGTPPTAGIIAPEGNITVNTTAQFTDNSTMGNSNITSWIWNFGDGDTSTEQNPTHNYTAADTYYVTLTVSDDYGLTDLAIVEVTVVEEIA